MHISLVRALWPLWLASPAALLHAQTLPDAGALRQQIEREFAPALPAQGRPLLPAETPPAPGPAGATLTVHDFRFEGNTLLTREQLLAAVRPFLGRPIGFAELQQAAQAVAEAYRRSGRVVRADLPAQDVTEGVVTLRIVEATYAGARLEEGGQEDVRVAPQRVLRYFDQPQASGAPLDTRALDRALLLANDLPGVAVTGALAPGQRDGETALVLRLHREPLVLGEASVDNGGSRSTGEWRAQVSASLASPLGRGDLWRADLLHAHGSDYYRLAWSQPVGVNGWRVGAHVSGLEYRIVAPEFAALAAHGRSTGAGLEALYPLWRSRTGNLYLGLGYDDRRFRNHANGALQSDYEVGVWSATLNGNVYDSWGQGGSSRFLLSWSEGRVAPRSMQAVMPTEATRFGKLRYGLSRQQTLSPAFALGASLSGQHAGKALDSSERFYLGGPAGVRAYPVNEGGGSRGQLLQLELLWRPAPGWAVTGFYDAGHVDPLGSAPDQTLKGFGLSLGWNTPMGQNLRLTWARRLGEHPQPGANGLDEDGTLKRNRWWLTASQPF